MAERELKCGDVVKLASHPNIENKMTMGVPQEQRDGYVECLWFDENRNLHRGHFPLDTLRLVE